ncbi:succinylglutamate desuccinylase/aspartoacylase family protein [Haloferula chungangensis]|uniref:Succinylglutamate desuccinylase/aspartoacylase family protein n=1 Tax=Haloferula chungangensis TaxID=1048331 RepID=A0ABW2L7C5_9BACT
MPRSPKIPPFQIGTHQVEAGQRAQISLPVGSFLTHEELVLKAVVVHGKLPGPTLLLTACIHGDEYNGSEVIRRILRTPALKKLKGTLIAVPIVNRPGFVTRSRYMPDRRDLNRLFPGSPNGPLGSRLARVLSDSLLPLCDVVIDLHTGAVNRPNLPQIRITVDDDKALELAKSFAPPVILVAPKRESSFRGTCRDLNKPVLLFESGEALRLDTPSIRFGVQGVLSVMRQMGMLSLKKPSSPRAAPIISNKSYWERAPRGGIFTPLAPLGRVVTAGSVIGFIADPYGSAETEVTCTRSGIVIGRTNDATADEGDGLFHIAMTDKLDSAEDRLAMTSEALPSLNADTDDHPVPYDSIQDTVI